MAFKDLLVPKDAGAPGRSRDPTFDHAPEDIPDGVIHDLAVSFLRNAQELFARPETQGRYLLWRREQFRLGNPLGLTPIPDDLLL